MSSGGLASPLPHRTHDRPLRTIVNYRGGNEIDGLDTATASKHTILCPRPAARPSPSADHNSQRNRGSAAAHKMRKRLRRPTLLEFDNPSLWIVQLPDRLDCTYGIVFATASPGVPCSVTAGSHCHDPFGMTCYLRDLGESPFNELIPCGGACPEFSE
jgi:hypothetical protein